MAGQLQRRPVLQREDPPGGGQPAEEENADASEAKLQLRHPAIRWQHQQHSGERGQGWRRLEVPDLGERVVPQHQHQGAGVCRGGRGQDLPLLGLTRAAEGGQGGAGREAAPRSQEQQQQQCPVQPRGSAEPREVAHLQPASSQVARGQRLVSGDFVQGQYNIG